MKKYKIILFLAFINLHSVDSVQIGNIEHIVRAVFGTIPIVVGMAINGLMIKQSFSISSVDDPSKKQLFYLINKLGINLQSSGHWLIYRASKQQFYLVVAGIMLIVYCNGHFWISKTKNMLNKINIFKKEDTTEEASLSLSNKDVSPAKNI